MPINHHCRDVLLVHPRNTNGVTMPCMKEENMQINVPLRPVRYAIVALHAIRESLTQLEDRLEEYAETIEDQPQGKAEVNRGTKRRR